MIINIVIIWKALLNFYLRIGNEAPEASVLALLDTGDKPPSADDARVNLLYLPTMGQVLIRSVVEGDPPKSAFRTKFSTSFQDREHRNFQLREAQYVPGRRNCKSPNNVSKI